jgi:CNT family concentrative nucleoside transporter
MSIFRGIIGLTFIIGLSYLFSSNRKKVSWRVVGFGLLAQIILAFGILKIPAVAWVFETVGKIFVVILDFTREGSVFLLGDLLNADSFGFIFAFQVLPTIIFFSALTSLLFYLGIIQKVVYYMALVMTKLLRISGAESLSVAGNIFLGQTESPLMIKAYLDKMNRSEMLLVMSGGMATLAGGVLAAYIAFLGGTDPVQRLIFAKHLLAASVMAAPGVIVISKILIPQTESIDTDVVVSKEKIGSNVLDAISNGTSEGLKLAANVAAMLLTFIAMIALANFVLMKIGDVTGLNTLIHNIDPSYDGLSLKFIMGYVFAPIVWLMGVVAEDITLVGRLLGEKLIMTEFIAYVSLAELKSVGDAAFGSFVSEKSIIMSTYALCGFANFASIGIQIGGIGTLAPNKRKLISELGFRALLAGSLASLLSATIVGMILG